MMRAQNGKLGAQFSSQSLSRRRMLQGTGLVGTGVLATALVGCGDDDDTPQNTPDNSSPTSTNGSPAASPTSASSGDVNTGGTINQGWNVTTNLWNPYETSSSIGHHYTMITDTLIRLDPQTMEPQPAVVEDWEIVEPGLEYVLKVRDGVRWHDKAPTNGRMLTAEDVAYSLRVASALEDPENAAKIVRASAYRGLERVEVTDESTVRVTLSQPNSAILNAMGDWRQYVIPVEMPDELAWEDPATFPGVGPFVCDEYRDGERITYSAFRDHWETPYPYVDGVVTQGYGDRASLFAAMLAGDVDLLANVTGVAERRPLEARDDVQLVDYIYRAYQAIFINSERPQLQDPRIWKAFQLAMDYKQTNDAISGEGLWAYTGPFLSAFSEATQPDQISQMPGYNPETKDEDVAEAKRLMEAAGHPEGEGLNLSITPQLASGEHFDVSVRFQALMQAAFPQMQLDITPAADAAGFQRALVDRSYDLATYIIYEAPDPRLALNSSWYSTSNRNYGNLNNERFDALVDQSFTVEGEESTALMQEAEQVLFEDGYPMVMVKAYVQSFAVSSALTGFEGRVGPGTSGAISDPYRVSRYLHFK